MMGESTPVSEKPPDWYIAREGISLLLNNQIEQADNLFSSNSHNFHIKAGRCFYVFMNALMSFEEEKLQQAIVLLREMEKECASDIGWFKSVKSKVFGTSLANEDYVTNLEREVILADTQVCCAILTLLQQEMTSYVRAGWMLRKAWRVYQHSYNQILQLHQRTFGSSPSGVEPIVVDATCSSPSPATPSSEVNGWSVPSVSKVQCLSSAVGSSGSGLRTSLSMILSFTGLYTSPESDHPATVQQQNFVEPTEVIRLMSAVSFGYGIFQLCVSLLPPSLLKVTHFLGFEGDRQRGLVSLMHSRLSKDMRAPLATLALLWYHTIVRPFFGLDGPNNKLGVETAKQLIAENQQEFQHSALFLFFSGRVKRLECDINGALEAYQKAVHISQQREIKLLCLHEVAWCHLICLNYDKANSSFSRLQHESRWSVLFYAYLSAVCCGAQRRFDDLTLIYRKMCHCVVETTKETQQLNLFIARRFSKLINHCDNEPYTDHLYYRLLIYELLYLWNALSSCSIDTLKLILSECKSNTLDREPMVGLRDLIEASILAYLDEKDASIKSYENCLQHRKLDDSIDCHISAYALYELGTLLCNDNKIDEGKAALIKAQTQYKDYDFENRLNVRINTAFKYLNQST